MTNLLRVILILSGLGIMALGLNIGLGGIMTLGWQGTSDFLSITDHQAFAIQDNHIRFIAGVWFAVGVIFAAGAFALERLRSILIALIAMIVVGGFMRLSSANMSVLTSPDILPSLMAELLLFPLLGLWIYRNGRPVA